MRSLYEIERDISRLQEEKSQVIAEYIRVLNERGVEIDEETCKERYEELCKIYREGMAKDVEKEAAAIHVIVV
ncbi:hypothetical protein COJ42_17155 [Bacillus cereus]|uniref:Uncharacterized protein n=1 Tax=Bacillus cereus TaxID=1396 RepID=A0A2C1CUF7_BACCE|nr:hypothetical protein [Bacillus cereus]PEX45976.1 hypothetical protein CN464_17140 [Bacillus cereus]PFM31712.1 hypothetical protein COJ42_17155 [Bacillus cereus]PFP82590.1 hypothetical protein COK02_30735 [Bacillus cereus]PGS91865.1 hypothetical protein COD09_27095 [Bacillus cereus]